MAINKVVFGSNTLVDLTADSVTPQTLAAGATAHNAAGEAITGTAYKNTYYVKGTQTASTGAWTGALPEVDELYEGLTIDYWLPFAGSGNATLNLTLKDGTQTGAVNCYYGGTSRLTTHLPAQTIVRLVYQTVTINNVEYTGWWTVRAWYANDTAYSLYHAGAYIADSAVYRYQLLFQVDDNTLTPLNNENNKVATTKAMLTNVEFDPLGEILYWNSSVTVAANGTVSSGTPRYAHNIDLRYTLNSGQTLTAGKPLYLKVILQDSGMVKLAADPCWTHTLPTTNDGYLYIYLGRTYNNYCLALHPWHPVYYHDGTKLRQYHGIPNASQTAAGLMSAADKLKLDNMGGGGYTLPIASASELGGVKIGTNLSINSTGVLSAKDTKYTASSENIGSASAGTAIAADDITAWSAGSLPEASYDADTETLELTFGTLPSLAYTARSIPNISVTQKSVVTGIAAA